MKKALRSTIIVLIAIMAMAIATVSASAATSVNIKEDAVRVYAGGTKNLGYSYQASETPKWSSSDASIATVNQKGQITAKKTGTVEITLEADNVEDTCKVVVTANAKWNSVDEAYTYLNNYRKANYNKELKKAKSIKNKKKSKKAVKKVNKKFKKTVTLKRDANLEKIAKIRAEEMAKTGKFSHTRPNGKSGLTLITGNKAKGENIAMGQKTCSQVSVAWYNSKGHRDNMLRTNFTKVGIACYEYKGVTYWAQVFSN